MQELIPGQKIKINNTLELNFDSFYDVSCFCLNKDNKLISDEHMVFYNQPTSPDNSISLDNTGGKQKFSLNLDKVSPDVEKMSFVITSDDKKIKDLNNVLSCKTNDFSFAMNANQLQDEKALMFCEVYKKDGQWRYNAFGQGFNAGLAAVLEHYGSSAAESAPVVETPKVEAAKPVSLSKISLTKNSPPAKISLAKDVASNATIEVSTMWYDNGDGNSGNDDLDLRVGLLMPDGRMTMIHGGGDAGSLTGKPFIQHGGDVRVVQGSVGIEKVNVNPNISNNFGGKVAIVFSVYSAVGNGAVSVASLKPKMEIKTKESVVTCEFNTSVDNDPSIYTYVIGIIEIDGDKLTVKQLGMTSEPRSEETPWINRDDSGEAYVQINGPHHFKGERISKNSVSVGMGGPSLFGKKIKRELRFVEHNSI